MWGGWNFHLPHGLTKQQQQNNPTGIESNITPSHIRLLLLDDNTGIFPYKNSSSFVSILISLFSTEYDTKKKQFQIDSSSSSDKICPVFHFNTVKMNDTSIKSLLYPAWGTHTSDSYINEINDV